MMHQRDYKDIEKCLNYDLKNNGRLQVGSLGLSNRVKYVSRTDGQLGNC